MKSSAMNPSVPPNQHNHHHQRYASINPLYHRRFQKVFQKQNNQQQKNSGTATAQQQECVSFLAALEDIQRVNFETALDVRCQSQLEEFERQEILELQVAENAEEEDIMRKVAAMNRNFKAASSPKIFGGSSTTTFRSGLEMNAELLHQQAKRSALRQAAQAKKENKLKLMKEFLAKRNEKKCEIEVFKNEEIEKFEEDLMGKNIEKILNNPILQATRGEATAQSAEKLFQPHVTRRHHQNIAEILMNNDNDGGETHNETSHHPQTKNGEAMGAMKKKKKNEQKKEVLNSSDDHEDRKKEESSSSWKNLIAEKNGKNNKKVEILQNPPTITAAMSDRFLVWFQIQSASSMTKSGRQKAQQEEDEETALEKLQTSSVHSPYYFPYGQYFLKGEKEEQVVVDINNDGQKNIRSESSLIAEWKAKKRKERQLSLQVFQREEGHGEYNYPSNVDAKLQEARNKKHELEVAENQRKLLFEKFIESEIHRASRQVSDIIYENSQEKKRKDAWMKYAVLGLSFHQCFEKQFERLEAIKTLRKIFSPVVRRFMERRALNQVNLFLIQSSQRYAAVEDEEGKDVGVEQEAAGSGRTNELSISGKTKEEKEEEVYEERTRQQEVSIIDDAQKIEEDNEVENAEEASLDEQQFDELNQPLRKKDKDQLAVEGKLHPTPTMTTTATNNATTYCAPLDADVLLNNAYDLQKNILVRSRELLSAMHYYQRLYKKKTGATNTTHLKKSSGGGSFSLPRSRSFSNGMMTRGGGEGEEDGKVIRSGNNTNHSKKYFSSSSSSSSSTHHIDDLDLYALIVAYQREMYGVDYLATTGGSGGDETMTPSPPNPKAILPAHFTSHHCRPEEEKIPRDFSFPSPNIASSSSFSPEGGGNFSNSKARTSQEWSRALEREKHLQHQQPLTFLELMLCPLFKMLSCLKQQQLVKQQECSSEAAAPLNLSASIAGEMQMTMYGSEFGSITTHPGAIGLDGSPGNSLIPSRTSALFQPPSAMAFHHQSPQAFGSAKDAFAQSSYGAAVDPIFLETISQAALAVGDLPAGSIQDILSQCLQLFQPLCLYDGESINAVIKQHPHHGASTPPLTNQPERSGGQDAALGNLSSSKPPYHQRHHVTYSQLYRYCMEEFSATHVVYIRRGSVIHYLPLLSPSGEIANNAGINSGSASGASTSSSTLQEVLHSAPLTLLPLEFFPYFSPDSSSSQEVSPQHWSKSVTNIMGCCQQQLPTSNADVFSSSFSSTKQQQPPTPAKRLHLLRKDLPGTWINYRSAVFHFTESNPLLLSESISPLDCFICPIEKLRDLVHSSFAWIYAVKVMLNGAYLLGKAGVGTTAQNSNEEEGKGGLLQMRGGKNNMLRGGGGGRRKGLKEETDDEAAAKKLQQRRRSTLLLRNIASAFAKAGERKKERQKKRKGEHLFDDEQNENEESQNDGSSNEVQLISFSDYLANVEDAALVSIKQCRHEVLVAPLAHALPSAQQMARSVVAQQVELFLVDTYGSLLSSAPPAASASGAYPRTLLQAFEKKRENQRKAMMLQQTDNIKGVEDDAAEDSRRKGGEARRKPNSSSMHHHHQKKKLNKQQIEILKHYHRIVSTENILTMQLHDILLESMLKEAVEALQKMQERSTVSPTGMIPKDSEGEGEQRQKEEGEEFSSMEKKDSNSEQQTGKEKTLQKPKQSLSLPQHKEQDNKTRIKKPEDDDQTSRTTNTFSNFLSSPSALQKVLTAAYDLMDHNKIDILRLQVCKMILRFYKNISTTSLTLKVVEAGQIIQKVGDKLKDLKLVVAGKVQFLDGLRKGSILHVGVPQQEYFSGAGGIVLTGGPGGEFSKRDGMAAMEERRMASRSKNNNCIPNTENVSSASMDLGASHFSKSEPHRGLWINDNVSALLGENLNKRQIYMNETNWQHHSLYESEYHVQKFCNETIRAETTCLVFELSETDLFHSLFLMDRKALKRVAWTIYGAPQQTASSSYLCTTTVQQSRMMAAGRGQKVLTRSGSTTPPASIRSPSSTSLTPRESHLETPIIPKHTAAAAALITGGHTHDDHDPTPLCLPPSAEHLAQRRRAAGMHEGGVGGGMGGLLQFQRKLVLKQQQQTMENPSSPLSPMTIPPHRTPQIQQKESLDLLTMAAANVDHEQATVGENSEHDQTDSKSSKIHRSSTSQFLLPSEKEENEEEKHLFLLQQQKEQMEKENTARDMLLIFSTTAHRCGRRQQDDERTEATMTTGQAQSSASTIHQHYTNSTNGVHGGGGGGGGVLGVVDEDFIKVGWEGYVKQAVRRKYPSPTKLVPSLSSSLNHSSTRPRPAADDDDAILVPQSNNDEERGETEQEKILEGSNIESEKGVVKFIPVPPPPLATTKISSSASGETANNKINSSHPQEQQPERRKKESSLLYNHQQNRRRDRHELQIELSQVEHDARLVEIEANRRHREATLAFLMGREGEEKEGEERSTDQKKARRPMTARTSSTRQTNVSCCANHQYVPIQQRVKRLGLS